MPKETSYKQTANSSPDPKQTFKNLIEGNMKYAEQCCCEFEKLKTKQSPHVTLLTCCDSRVPQTLFDVEGLNELFVVKNIGNQFRNSEGSVKYPLIHLKTPLLIVLGHTGCGAIKAALSDYRGEDDAIQREIIGLVNSIRAADKKIDMSQIADEIKFALYAQINVDRQIQKIISDYALRGKVEKGDLYVVGMMFDIHCLYGKEAAHTYITNVNGVTDASEIKKLDLVNNLGKKTVDALVKRL